MIKQMMTATAFKCSPILLIGFNRPNYMRALVTAIRAGRPSRIYIAVDGLRDDYLNCSEVRDCVKVIDWPCEIKTLFRKKDLGCKIGVSSAISWFFDNEEMGIVLEDDCCPTTDFLRFASELLVRYRNNERIGLIAGFNAFDLQSDRHASYHFSEHLDIWGWASWRRVWNKYDVTMAKYSDRADILIQ